MARIACTCFTFSDGGFERGAHRRVQTDLRFGEVRIRHELGADERHQKQAAEERGRRDDQRDRAMPQRPAEQALIERGEPVDLLVEQMQGTFDDASIAIAFAARVRVMQIGVRPDRRQHRVERERHEHRDQHGGGDRDAELMEEAADDAAHEAHRQEHRDDREGGRQHGERDFLRAVERGRAVVGAELHVPHDVLAHHDRVVDQQADAQDSAISVITLIVKPHAYITANVPISAIGSVRPVITVLRHEPRNRNTISTVSSAPSSKRALHFVDAFFDVDRRIVGDVELDARWQLRLQQRATASRTPCATSTVFSPCALMIDRNNARWPLSKRHAVGFLLTVHHVGDLIERDRLRRR